LGVQQRHTVPRQVYIEETLPESAVAKVAKPVRRERLRGGGERTPDPPPGSGPFGINLYLPNGPWCSAQLTFSAEPARRIIVFQQH